MPEDRVFMLYNYFDNAILVPSPTEHTLDINRYTPGFEKTFWDHSPSFELRIPFANAQNSDLYLGGNGAEQDTEFGNLEATLKFLIWRRPQWACATRVGFNMPTARNARLFEAGSTQPAFTIRNEAVRVQPYMGLLYTPGKRLFVQAFVQFDIDTNGNSMSQQNVGRVGHCTIRICSKPICRSDSGGIEDPAPIRDGDRADDRISLYQDDSRREVRRRRHRPEPIHTRQHGQPVRRPDLTLGFEFLLGQHSTLNVAGVVSLNGLNPNRQFDSEAFVEFNRFFPPTPELAAPIFAPPRTTVYHRGKRSTFAVSSGPVI